MPRFKGHYIQLVADETYIAAKKKSQKERAQTLQETRSGTGSHVAQALIATVMTAQNPQAAAMTLGDGVTSRFRTGFFWQVLWNVFLRLAALFGMWTVMRQLMHWCQGLPAADLGDDSDPEEADRDRRGVTRAEIAEENAFLQNHINELDVRIAVLEEENHMLQSIQGQMVHQYAQAMRLLSPEQQRAILAESDAESD